jgi:hypothetical protein
MKPGGQDVDGEMHSRHDTSVTSDVAVPRSFPSISLIATCVQPFGRRCTGPCGVRATVDGMLTSRVARAAAAEVPAIVRTDRHPAPSSMQVACRLPLPDWRSHASIAQPTHCMKIAINGGAQRPVSAVLSSVIRHPPIRPLLSPEQRDPLPCRTTTGPQSALLVSTRYSTGT